MDTWEYEPTSSDDAISTRSKQTILETIEDKQHERGKISHINQKQNIHNREAVFEKTLFDELESWHTAGEKYKSQTRQECQTLAGQTISRLVFISVVKQQNEKSSDNATIDIGKEVETMLHAMMLHCGDPFDTILKEMDMDSDRLNQDDKCKDKDLGDLLKKKFKDKSPGEKGPYKSNPWLNDMTGGIVFVNGQQDELQKTKDNAKDHQAIIGFLEGPIQKLLYLLQSIEDVFSSLSQSSSAENEIDDQGTFCRVSSQQWHTRKERFADWSETTRILLCSEDCPIRGFTLPLRMFSVTPLISLKDTSKGDNNDKNTKSTNIIPKDIQAMILQIYTGQSTFIPKVAHPVPTGRVEAKTGTISNSHRSSTTHCTGPSYVLIKMVTPLTHLDHQRIFPNIDQIVANCFTSGDKTANPFPTWKQFKQAFGGAVTAKLEGDCTFPPWMWFNEAKADLCRMKNTIQ
jgi:hypothetical protein